MASPVCGLRPMRALRFDFTRRPRPGTTNTPFFFVSLTASSASDPEKLQLLVVHFVFLGQVTDECVLVMPVAICKSSLNIER